MKKQFSRWAGFALVLVFASATAIAALAQNGSAHPVEGTYSISSVSPEMGTITYLLVLKKSADKWTAEIKDSPLPLTITTTTVDAENNIVLIADVGGTAVEIKGKFDAGKIKGNWTAGELKGTLEGTKKDEAKAATAPTAPATGGGAAAGLEGTYDAKIGAEGQGELPFTLVIKKDGDKLKTEVPERGVLNVIEIKVDGDNVTLVATYQGQGPIMLPGKRTGDELGGKWEFSGMSGTWKATKKK